MARQDTDPDATADQLGFAERLILAEERRRPPATQPPPHRPEVVVIERRDFTASTGFYVQEPGRTMPIEGAGSLDSVVVIAKSPDFAVDIEVDGRTVLSESFATLKDRAAELNRVSAYERDDGNEVFAAEDYPFQMSVGVVIRPQSSITFAYQRAELDVDRGTAQPPGT